MNANIDNRAELAWIFDLYRMTPAISKVSPQDVSQRLLEHIVAGFNAESGCLALSDAEAPDRLDIVAGIALPPGVIGSHVALGDGVLGWVAQNAEPLLLKNDIQGDPRFRAKVARTETKVPGSAMCWPLLSEDRVVGAVSVNRAPTQPGFTQDDLEHGSLVMGLVTVMIENTRLHIEQAQRIEVLSTMNAVVNGINRQLEDTQSQLLQSEKMASIGLLAAGVAHEINNPIGYVNSNLCSLEQFLQELFAVLAAYEDLDDALPEAARRDIQAVKARVDLGYLRQDSVALLGECREGIDRVKKIVQDLRDFSRVDASDEWRWADLHKGLDSTLNIVNNEIKYKAEVIKKYGKLPEIECLPAQLNQVFMNILMNAAQSMQEGGTITVRTGTQGDDVWVAISDTGRGIPADQQKRIFEPFYTTKRVGEGTGLGLSLSYGIVEKHGGSIEVKSEVGVGTTFRVVLPRQQHVCRVQQVAAEGVFA
jgi:signal transduction histidine kinase